MITTAIDYRSRRPAVAEANWRAPEKIERMAKIMMADYVSINWRASEREQQPDETEPRITCLPLCCIAPK